jgi:hypothetical protein
MKKYLFYILIFSTLSCKEKSEEKLFKSCFTMDNFDLVYEYIEIQNKTTNSNFQKYGEFEVLLRKDSLITLVKGNSVTKIFRNKGIVPIQMYKPTSDKMKVDANHLFCELVEIAKQKI